MREVLIAYFHDYMNNFCTVAGFANHHDLTEVQAKTVLMLGRELDHQRHERQVVP